MNVGYKETVGMGSQYVYPYGPAVGVRENLELKKGIEEVLAENRKLREKVERLEKAQLSQSEEDPKFSTPTGDNPKEAETPSRRLIDHRREVSMCARYQRRLRPPTRRLKDQQSPKAAKDRRPQKARRLID